MVKKVYIYNLEEDKKILAQKSEKVKEITDEVKQEIEDLKDTLHSVGNAVGISAIQIGVPKQICICRWGGQEIVMINPVITRKRGETKYVEGCLSVPGVYKEVTRAQKVWCTYLDENGNQQEIAEGGRMSDIIQHEMDHFTGSCKLLEVE